MLGMLVCACFYDGLKAWRGLTYLKEERERDAGGEGGVAEEVVDESGAIGLGVVVSQTGIEWTR